MLQDNGAHHGGLQPIQYHFSPSNYCFRVSGAVKTKPGRSASLAKFYDSSQLNRLSWWVMLVHIEVTSPQVAARPWCQSCTPLHSKDAQLDRDLATAEAVNPLSCSINDIQSWTQGASWWGSKHLQDFKNKPSCSNRTLVLFHWTSYWGKMVGCGHRRTNALYFQLRLRPKKQKQNSSSLRCW